MLDAIVLHYYKDAIVLHYYKEETLLLLPVLKLRHLQGLTAESNTSHWPSYGCFVTASERKLAKDP